jgi:transcriptional regulator with XRE-family HTH domain
MELDLTKNFRHIFAAVANKGIKRTAFAKAMGYSSTSQLSVTLEGEAMISTKAIIELIKNFNINPTYLFTGRGEIFLTEKDELDQLKTLITRLEMDKNEITKKALELADMVKVLEKRNGDLIDITALALRNYKKDEDKSTMPIKTVDEL